MVLWNYGRVFWGRKSKNAIICDWNFQVPVEGFKNLKGGKFKINGVVGGENSLPKAHTCFNEIELPKYSSKELMKSKLDICISMGLKGFGFGWFNEGET